MPHVSLETRRRIVTLKGNGFSVKQIHSRLADEGIVHSLKSIHMLIKKFKITKSVKDLPRRSRPKLLNFEQYSFIDKAMAENDEPTVNHLHDMLMNTYPNLQMSKNTVKKARRDLGWVSTTPRYCQLIREVNKEKRLLFALQLIKDKENFGDIIWSDECSVQLERHSRRCYRRKGKPKSLKPKPKHPYKVHIWGGISCRGATKLVIFNGILVSTRLLKIYENSLLPFVKSAFPDGHRFMQDNDPKHCSNLAKNFLKDHNINWWKTPPESPDMYPIENVWGSLKTHLRNKVKPTNQETLIAGIRSFWKTLTPEVCRRYIFHLKRVVPKVIEENGGPSGY